MGINAADARAVQNARRNAQEDRRLAMQAQDQEMRAKQLESKLRSDEVWRQTALAQAELSAKMAEHGIQTTAKKISQEDRRLGQIDTQIRQSDERLQLAKEQGAAQIAATEAQTRAMEAQTDLGERQFEEGVRRFDLTRDDRNEQWNAEFGLRTFDSQLRAIGLEENIFIGRQDLAIRHERHNADMANSIIRAKGSMIELMNMKSSLDAQQQERLTALMESTRQAIRGTQDRITLHNDTLLGLTAERANIGATAAGKFFDQNEEHDTDDPNDPKAFEIKDGFAKQLVGFVEGGTRAQHKEASDFFERVASDTLNRTALDGSLEKIATGEATIDDEDIKAAIGDAVVLQMAKTAVEDDPKRPWGQSGAMYVKLMEQAETQGMDSLSPSQIEELARAKGNLLAYAEMDGDSKWKFKYHGAVRKNEKGQFVATDTSTGEKVLENFTHFVRTNFNQELTAMLGKGIEQHSTRIKLKEEKAYLGEIDSNMKRTKEGLENWAKGMSPDAVLENMNSMRISSYDEIYSMTKEDLAEIDTRIKLPEPPPMPQYRSREYSAAPKEQPRVYMTMSPAQQPQTVNSMASAVKSAEEAVGEPWATGASSTWNNYGEDILRVAKENNLPPAAIVAMATIESSGDKGAKSKTGVEGLMQVTQETFDWIYPEGTDRTDPIQSLEAGAKYMAYLRDEFGSDYYLVAGAYNNGHSKLKNMGNNISRLNKEGREHAKRFKAIYDALVAANPDMGRFVRGPGSLPAGQPGGTNYATDPNNFTFPGPGEGQ